MSTLTIQLKLLASALELNRHDIAAIVTLGGIETSSSRADRWLRSASATKNATGNSDVAGARINRTDVISQAEFHAFCVGLKPWLASVSEKE